MIYDITFIVPGNPQELKRHRTFRRGTFTGQYDPSKGDKADFLAKAMLFKPDVPFDEPLSVALSFYFQRPKAHYRSGKKAHLLKENAPIWHTKTPDADNLVKFVCDALNGIFWKDDSRICELSIVKQFSITPHIGIQIKRLGNVKTPR